MPTGSDVAILLPMLVALLQNAATAFFLENENNALEEDHSDGDVGSEHRLFVQETILASVRHDYRLRNIAFLFPADLGWWVLPRSTTWFSRFVMYEFDDERWIKNFRMPKGVVLCFVAVLSPHVQKQDTRYRRVVPVVVRVCCTLYKLAQGASLIQCSESFAVGVSTVCEMLRDVVRAINVEFRSQIQWPIGNEVTTVMNSFHRYCSLPAVAGAIDGTHFEIRKPATSPEDYFYFKSSSYTIQCQVVVDVNRKFLDVAVGMPGSTHDVRVLKRSALYHRATHQNLFDPAFSQEGFSPYLSADKGYPLLPWLMTPHREVPNRERSYADRLYNRKLRKGRSVVEHAFGILKQCFRELGGKSDLHVTFLPDVIVACCLMHNLLLGQFVDDVEQLLEVLQSEGMRWEGRNDQVVDRNENAQPIPLHAEVDSKRTELGAYLANRRLLR